ncbi:MAG: CusA/CzcA family heavy metal efflux RND transporter [Saprospiraceae bacterium]
MLERIINYSIQHKLIILLFTGGLIGFGLYALSNIPIGAVPDVTNNQVQVITTSRNLSTQDVEQFITYPVELEMANLPGVKEIRSISKFGLSVVTIVFEDKMGTYLPRQLIAEKIKSAEAQIPQGFGSPFMGPVSTGLGEIYQYILDVKPDFKDQYSIMDLRTIQDWIVKRQLSGIPGVVEVNTWGGQLKQYEVAVNPERLKAMGISLHDIYQALADNNSVAGGGYIEKTNESYFIRGEGLIDQLQDIEQIVVSKREDVPVLIKDIAKVQFGYATRFGAITANGEGEKVLGQVMMLKDANSKAVIERVRARVAEVQKSLPEGVFINPFLDRSELIQKTTNTVAENLILGCLIVIFVVVILLGNLRSGFVVASVIPLSLLFAISLMYLFGVDANLMSLGAIDFGIIIDGAVIIVEYIAFQISKQSQELLPLRGQERTQVIDRITFNSTRKMLRSAVFGQLIIIIVFIPILSLSEVEGKMFQPMAMTFCFALVGAMILCFTYVPVMAALILKPSPQGKRNISVRIITFLNRLYSPVIRWALRFKGVVLSIAIGILAIAAFLFMRMGGEFVPTLDEGDFVIQPVLKTGTTLSKTIETTTQIEQILHTFPEVRQVVTRIGAAEVPTDPMSMEESDVIITLNPPSTWTSATNKDELADAFKDALSVIPGLDYEFTQPIEMRFNELITGVRADLAIKLFGDDLEVLNLKAQEIKQAIESVEGAADISVEKVAGLPQMSVRYKRDKLARYGISIAEVNQLLTMGFAGLPAGSVFEGEKQFDLVVRYEPQYRTDIEHIKNTTFISDRGIQIPLHELAEISYTKGPAKISRDDTKRRIVVGVNVRNRDLESVVKDVQAIIESKVQIPVGYSLEYGGQFENLRNARARLSIAVPIALLLIFILLFFAFQSIQEALMVFSAIPLAAIGGVLSLYLRDMPFSISAGVGFIALFGIAVLNGIVLIEHFKELKANGMHNLNRRILIGTRDRLRPVLLTAFAAALGFIPMALSTSAGAEVQRPLATVVVGGLITATILTLIILPVLYALFHKSPVKNNRNGKYNFLLLLIPMFYVPQQSHAQVQEYSLEEVIQIALDQNTGLKARQLTIQQRAQLFDAAYDLEKTQVYLMRDQNNIAENGQAITVLGFQQNFDLPGVYKSKQALGAQKVILQQKQLALDQQVLKKEVSKAFQQILYWENILDNYTYLDSLYADLVKATTRRFELGESNYLEKITAETKKKEIALQLAQCSDNIEANYQSLNKWVQAKEAFRINISRISPLNLPDLTNLEHPLVQYYEAAGQVAEQEMEVEQKRLLPSVNVEYFLGANTAAGSRIYQGFQLGMGLPLFRKSLDANIQIASIQQELIQQQALNQKNRLEAEQQHLLIQLRKHERALQFYQTEGQQLAEEITRNAYQAFQNGDLDLLLFIQALENANRMKKHYLDNIIQYNLTIIDLQYSMPE